MSIDCSWVQSRNPACMPCRPAGASTSSHEAGSGADLGLIDAYLQQLLPALAKASAGGGTYKGLPCLPSITASTCHVTRSTAPWCSLAQTGNTSRLTVAHLSHSVAYASCCRWCRQLGPAGTQQRCLAGCRTATAHYQCTVQVHGGPCRCAAATVHAGSPSALQLP